MENRNVMTYEKVLEIKDKRIPAGYLVSYHEMRGYDSPSRWYEIKRGNQLLKEFSKYNKEKAIQFCIKDFEENCNNG